MTIYTVKQSKVLMDHLEPKISVTGYVLSKEVVYSRGLYVKRRGN